MGGHGGLNILPQKKWNVYNRDNREKVEKDKRKAEEKRQAQVEEQERGQALCRLQKLKIQRNQNEDSSEKDKEKGKNYEKYLKKQEKDARKEQKEKKIQHQNSETKKKEQQSSHINLFQTEQRTIEDEQLIKISMQNKTFFDGKPYGPENALGQFNDDKYQKPWYYNQDVYNKLRIKEEELNKQKSNEKEQKQFMKQINNFSQNNDSSKFYQIINLPENQQQNSQQVKDNLFVNENREIIQQKSQKEKHRSLSEDSNKYSNRSRSRSKRQSNKKSKKEKKKHKEERKESKKLKKEKQDKYEQLKQKRLLREQQERKREIDIIHCQKHIDNKIYR